MYDRYGEEGLNNNFGGGGGASFHDFGNFSGFNFSSFDPHDTFKKFFGDEDPWKGMYSTSERA